MNIFHKIQACFVLMAVLALTGCNGQLIRKAGTSAPDAYDIEKLANAAYEKNDWVESEKHYSELVNRIPENPIHWFRLGNVYTRTQRPDAAVVAYREALIRDPKMTKAWYNMGVLQLKQSAKSFEQLKVYGDKNNALYPRGRDLLNGIIGLMQGQSDKSGAAAERQSSEVKKDDMDNDLTTNGDERATKQP